METDPQIAVFAGSLAAIFALSGLAWWLKLGAKPRLRDDQVVRTTAGQIEDGFDADLISISRNGDAALAAEATGRIMVIKRHGNQFAGRILGASSQANEVVDGLVVDCGEARFGTVHLSLTDSSTWADRINRLSLRNDA
ncbi:MAG: hypothetical protein AAFQ27_06985 [Pseudomonadota bacterium]